MFFWEYRKNVIVEQIDDTLQDKNEGGNYQCSDEDSYPGYSRKQKN